MFHSFLANDKVRIRGNVNKLQMSMDGTQGDRASRVREVDNEDIL